MASPSLCPGFETNLMSNRKVIELVLQLNSAKAHGKNYITVKPYLVRHLLRNRLFYCSSAYITKDSGCVHTLLIDPRGIAD